MRIRSLCCLAALAASLVVVGCSSDDTPADGGGLELYPTTKVLDEATLKTATAVSPDQATLTFGGATPVLDGIVVGDVVLGGIGPLTPSGVLRKVTNVTRDGAGITLTTTPAALTDAIARGTIKLPRTQLTRASAQVQSQPGITVQSAASSATSLAPARLKPLDEPTIDDVGNGAGAFARDFTVGIPPIEVGEGVTAGGSLGFGIGVDLDMTISLKKLEAKMTLSGNQSVTLDVRALAGASIGEKRYPLSEFYFPPIPVQIGPVQLVITTKLIVDLGIRGQTSGEAEWSATEEGNIGVALALSTSLDKPKFIGSVTAKSDPPRIGGDLDVAAFAGLRLEASVNALIASASLTAGAEGYVKLNATSSRNPCFIVSAGVDGVVDVDAKLLGVEIAEDQFRENIYDKPFVEGVCSNEPVASWATVVGVTDFDTGPGFTVLPDDSVLVASDAAGSTGALSRLSPRGVAMWSRKIDGTVGISSVNATGLTAINLTGSSQAGAAYGRISGAGDRLSLRRLTPEPGAPTFGAAMSAPAKDGGLWLGGEALSGNDFVPWVARIDASGNLVWASTYGAGLFTPYTLVETPDGGVLFAGTGSVSELSRAEVMKLSSTGDVVFANAYYGGYLFGVTPLGDGGFAATGTSDLAAAVFRAGASGDVTWSKLYRATGNNETRGDAIAERDGGLIVAGTHGFAGTADGWAIEFDGAGELGWSRAYGGAKADHFFGVKRISDGGFVFVGDTQSFGGTTKSLAMRVPPSGAITFNAASGATTKNIDGVAETLAITKTSLAAVRSSLAVTVKDAEAKEWTFTPSNAAPVVLAP